MYSDSLADNSTWSNIIYKVFMQILHVYIQDSKDPTYSTTTKVLTLNFKMTFPYFWTGGSDKNFRSWVSFCTDLVTKP